MTSKLTLISGLPLFTVSGIAKYLIVEKFKSLTQFLTCSFWPCMHGRCTPFIPLQRVKGFLFTPVWQKFNCGSVWQDGAGRDPDARWLLRRRDVGTEDACHRPPQGCVTEGHWGNPHRRSHAQTRGETRYECTLLSCCVHSDTWWLLKAAYLKCNKQAWAES